MDSPGEFAEQVGRKTPETVPSGSADQPDWSDLRTYTRAKQAIADLVRRLGAHFRRCGDELRVAACRELMVKLAEDRFTLPVLGQFNRGKSSLMNAVMGRQILPTGVLPLTSAITILRFGSREGLLVERKGWSFPQTAPLSALAEYVTQQGNPGNEKRVEKVYVELPLPFLRRGLEFVDTPGVGSAVDANTATTMDFLPRCDAALFVTSVDTPLTAAETELLAKVRQHVRKLIFVVNKTDLLDAQECQEVVAYIVRVLQRQMGASSLKVYATSSRRGLAAKVAGDNEAYRQSGLGPLEEAISSFLAVEKAATFLVAILDKAAAIASREVQELAVAEVQESIGFLRNVILRQDLAGLKTLDQASTAAAAAAGPQAEVQPGPVASQEPDLPSDLQQEGCPVCNHLVETAFEFYAKWQGKLSADEPTQRAFADQLGFCPLHTWQLAALASPLGLSLGYPRLLERLSGVLSSLSGDPPETAGPVAALIQSRESCQVCGLLRAEEKEHIVRLSRFLAEPAGREAYARCQGVCLRHLAVLLAASPTADLAKFLLSEAARQFDRFAEDMRNYAIKRDAIRRGLLTDDEEEAHLRALVHLAGHKGPCWPWSADGSL